MKLLKITSFCESYIKKIYSNAPELAEKSYAEQKLALDYDAFSWADFWSTALSPLGYDVIEITSNVKPMQRAWAHENDVSFNQSDWMLDITGDQIKSNKPDILFVQNHSIFPYKWLMGLKEKCPSIKLVLGWCGAPYHDETVFGACDIVLSCIPEQVEKFRKIGHRSEHMNHAFDPRILDRIDLDRAPGIDFSFIGSIVRSNNYHLKRERLLESIIQDRGIDIYSPSEESGLFDISEVTLMQASYEAIKLFRSMHISNKWLKKIPLLGRAADWETKPMGLLSPKLRRHLKPPVFGLEMFQKLKDSKVTLNSHIDCSPKSASNMRLFEATGVGTCLITDWKENLHELFEPDKEVIVYKTFDECLEKVQWLLDHSKEREEIAKAGQVRTLKEHTFNCRSVQLDEILRKELRM